MMAMALVAMGLQWSGAITIDNGSGGNGSRDGGG